MINPVTLSSDALGDTLQNTYLQYFRDQKPEYASVLGGAARLVLERIGNSDALYHNIEHTMMVTLVGQDILRGQLLVNRITPEDWLHFTFATLAHDIGYVRGVCREDEDNSLVIDDQGGRITPPRGASDAFLGPYHIDRGKIYVRERLGPSPFLDEERVARAIELTRFPVPDGDDHQETGTEAGLVRAADLIGQLADPFYHRKNNALFHEFAEIGVNEMLDYQTPSDVVDAYPEFFWSKVEPYIQTALRLLHLTTEGKQWIAHLYSNVFQVEHRKRRIGPFNGHNG